MGRRRTKIVLFTFPGVLAVSALLTLAGLLATLWHMAHWIAIAFLVVTILSFFVVILVVRGAQPREPPKATDAEGPPTPT